MSFLLSGRAGPGDAGWWRQSEAGSAHAIPADACRNRVLARGYMQAVCMYHTGSMYVKREDGDVLDDASSPAARGPRARQSLVTRAALLTVARELFAERGYAQVGTQEIVK